MNKSEVKSHSDGGRIWSRFLGYECVYACHCITGTSEIHCNILCFYLAVLFQSLFSFTLTISTQMYKNPECRACLWHFTVINIWSKVQLSYHAMWSIGNQQKQQQHKHNTSPPLQDSCIFTHQWAQAGKVEPVQVIIRRLVFINNPVSLPLVIISSEWPLKIFEVKVTCSVCVCPCTVESSLFVYPCVLASSSSVKSLEYF